MTDRELVNAALEMRSKAYTPYSRFQVGAAILCEDGSVFTGCNVENASYGATICAERTAAVSAIAAGHRDFVRIAVASSGEGYCLPCGVCRQFLSEFSHSLIFLCADPDGNYKEFRFEELLPNAFDSSVL